jgi:hypothetical protein
LNITKKTRKQCPRCYMVYDTETREADCPHREKGDLG